MSGLQNILFEREGRVGIVTLNRPQRLNALSSGLQNELTQLMETLENDDEIGAIIITGAPRQDGRPCFCAGADIKEMQETGTGFAEAGTGTAEVGLIHTLQSVGESKNLAWYSCFNKVYEFPKATIAAIDGICTAGGLELAMCCDIRVVADTAEIRDLHLKNLGVLGGGGLETWLPRLINVGKAKQLIWTGDAIDGNEAWRINFAQEVFPHGELMVRTKELAKKIAAMPGPALKMSKLAINSGLSQGVYDSLRFSAFCGAMLRYLTLDDQVKARQEFLSRKEK